MESLQLKIFLRAISLGAGGMNMYTDCTREPMLIKIGALPCVRLITPILMGQSVTSLLINPMFVILALWMERKMNLITPFQQNCTLR